MSSSLTADQAEPGRRAGPNFLPLENMSYADQSISGRICEGAQLFVAVLMFPFWAPFWLLGLLAQRLRGF